jgi:toxin ParE1/3/4
MRIEWSPHAVADLNAISEHIERDRNVRTANRVIRTIYDTVRTLRLMPYRGRPGRLGDTRELVIPRLPYIVIYEVSETRVAILSVLHGAQKWP